MSYDLSAFHFVFPYPDVCDSRLKAFAFLSVFDIHPAGRVNPKCVTSSNILSYKFMVVPKVSTV